MNNPINSSINYVLQDKDSVRWYFYLSDKKIFYCNKRYNHPWSPHESIDSPAIVGFSATIDSRGILYVLAFTTNRKLMFFEFSHGHWSSQVLEEISSRYQDIPYYSISSSALGIHILFYIDHSLKRSGETLTHYFVSGSKWHGGKLWKFLSDQITSFQNVCIDFHGNLHMIFTQQWREKLYLYYCSYDPLGQTWVEPYPIYSFFDPQSFRIIVDNQGGIHILWEEMTPEGYTIKYLTGSTTDNDQVFRESIIHKSTSRIKLPIMIEGHGLHCFWKEEDFLYRKSSQDFGRTWSKPEFLKYHSDYTSIPFNYVFVDKEVPRSMRIWGMAYPYIELAGIDSYPVFDKSFPSMETEQGSIPAYQHIPTGNAIGSADAGGTIASLRKENKNLKAEIDNLSSQVNNLNSAFYNLRDQILSNEKSFFNINASLKQLDFQMKQLRQTPGSGASGIPDTQSTKFKSAPIRLDEDGKIIAHSDIFDKKVKYETENTVRTNGEEEKAEGEEVKTEKDYIADKDTGAVIDKTIDEDLSKVHGENTDITAIESGVNNAIPGKNEENKPAESEQPVDKTIFDVEDENTEERIYLDNTVILINSDKPKSY